MRARVVESRSRNGVNTFRKKSRCRCESAAVIGGPSLFHTSDGGRVMTHAFFPRPRYTAKLSGVGASIRTARPVDQRAGPRRVDDEFLPGHGADRKQDNCGGRRQDVKTHDGSSVTTPGGGPRTVNRRRAAREWGA